MLTKQLKRKRKLLTMALAAALVLALCVTLLVACGGNKSQDPTDPGPIGPIGPEEHEHAFEITWANDPTCVDSGNMAYKYCPKCGKYFDMDDNEIDYADTVIPATGEHDLSDWIEERSATCKQRAKHYKMCYTCQQRIEEEEYGDLLEHVERTYPIVADVEPTCLTAGVGHTVCDLCGDTMTENIPLEALGHDFTWESEHYFTPATCTEDGNNTYYHCNVCNKNFASNDPLCDDEMSQEDIVIEKLGHSFDNDGDWHIDDNGHWHYCTRCEKNIDEDSHTGSESCEVCKWVNNPFKVTDYWDDNDEHGYKLTEYTGNDVNVDVPAQIGGVPIKVIGQGVFANRDEIKSVTLHEGVIELEEHAFLNCGITSLVLPEGLKTIGYQALLGCTELVEITFPESLELMESGLTASNSSVELELTTVNWNARNCRLHSTALFNHSEALTMKLTDINIGENVESLPMMFAYRHSASANVNVPTLKDWCEIDFESRDNNPLYNFAATLYADGEPVDFTNLVVPEGTARIGSYAFYQTGIETVTLPSTLKSVGREAFAENGAINSVAFNGTISQWCDIDFEGGSYNLHANPIYGHYQAAFTIGGQEIDGKDIVIEEGTTRIGAAALAYRNLGKITIPSSVKEIGTDAFYNAELSEIHFGGNLKDWSEIEFNGALLLEDGSRKLFAMVNGEEKEIKGEFTLPTGTTKIGDYAFYGLKGLTKLNMNNDGALKSVGEYAFSHSGLTTVTIPDSVETIDYCAFEGCESLATVYLGKSLTSMSFNAFQNSNVKSFEVDEDNEVYSSQTGVLYHMQYGALIIEIVPRFIEGEVIVKEGITQIINQNDQLFRDRPYITSIVLPTTLERLNYLEYSGGAVDNQYRAMTFYGCSSLKSIRMAGENETNGIFTSYKGVLYKNIGEGVYAICSIPSAIEEIEIIDGCTAIERYEFAEWEPDRYYQRLNSVPNLTKLTTITLPLSITDVDHFIFTQCDALEKIQFGKDNELGGNNDYKAVDGILYENYATVGDLENWQFMSIPNNLSGDVTVIDGVTKLYKDSDFTNSNVAEPYNFKDRANLRSLTLPQSMTDLPVDLVDNPFAGCLSLESITIKDGGNDVYATEGGILFKKDGDALTIYAVPEGIVNATIPATCTFIDGFKNHTKLESITLHEGITNLAQDAFDGCTSLVNINMSGAGENATFKTEGGILYKKNGDDLEYYIVPSGIGGAIEIIEGVTKIAEGAFKGTNITSLVIPDSVTEIGANAFEGCAQLETVTIGANVKKIGDSAFKDCAMLTTVNWNAHYCSTAGSSAGPIFYGCDRLSTVKFAEGDGFVPEYAFYGLKALKELTIDWGIGLRAFAYCGIETLTIGENVRTIESYAFSGNTDLTTVNYNAYSDDIDIPVTVYNGIFENCPSLTTVNISEKITSLPMIMNGSDITEFTIPENIVTLESSAFNNCKNLRSIDLANVTRIGQYAFGYCTSLSKVDLGKVEVIGVGAFRGCTQLTEIVIPDTTTTIGQSAFKECSQLATLTVGKAIETVNGEAFHDCTSLTTVYWNATNCTSVYGVTSESAGIFKGCDNLSTVVFGDDVQIVPNYAFYGVKGLKSLEVNVPTIGSYAFAKTSIETLTIGKDVKVIWGQTFWLAENLTTVYWNAVNCTEAGTQSMPIFLECRNLTTFIFGDEVEYIPSYVLAGKSADDPGNNVTEITIPEGVKKIDGLAFRFSHIVTFNFNAINCGNSSGSILSGSKFLESINIGDQVTRIPNELFSNIDQFTGVIVLPDSVTEVGRWAFSGNGAFSVVMGAGVQNFGSSWLGANVKIYYRGEQADIESATFDQSTDKTAMLSQTYYFSAEPNTDGKHWHWKDDQENGVPELWAA